MIIAEVVVLRNIRKSFDYLIDCTSKKKDLIGRRVLVQFGTKTIMAIIIDIKNNSNLPKEKLKYITTLIDQDTFFSTKELTFIQWAANYYHIPVGEVFDSVLPKKLKENQLFDKNIKYKIETVNTKNVKHNLTLNNSQKKAVKIISGKLNSFSTFLINGVTGSGKTEVYIRLVQEVIKNNKQVLILIPEIGLTPQTVSRFEQRFPNEIAIYHSKISPAKKAKTFMLVKHGEIKIVIGTRSAIWLPFTDPGLFIIDEEHDLSFRQQQGFKYSARDLLIKRANIHNCPIILGSATPSLESINNVINKKYTEIILSNRAGLSCKNTIDIIDLKKCKTTNSLSEHLITKIKTHLSQKKQVLLFLNRRGFARILLCYDCGWIKKCTSCDLNMVIHYSNWQLKCHHCMQTSIIPKICPSCKLSELDPVGSGTEKIELDIKALFPNNNIVRVDRDTINKKDSMQIIYDKMQNHEIDILIGTQMLAKGHHFPNITLSAVLDLDSGLFGVDFRSSERLGQLFTQVAGRAGRGENKGEVVLQTCYPNHPLLKLLINDNYIEFSKVILQQRSDLLLPPYSSQALIRTNSKINKSGKDLLVWIKEQSIAISIKIETIKLFGPMEAPITKKSGMYRNQLLIQAETKSQLQRFLKNLVPIIEQKKITSNCKWSIEVDPQDFL